MPVPDSPSALVSFPFHQRVLMYWNGFYAIRLYLPFSMLAQSLRRASRRIRGKVVPFEQAGHLPKVDWNAFVKSRRVGLLELTKENGNVRVSEVAVLAQLAADCPADSTIFEIGTFDGRTTLNLSLNAPPCCRVHSLDLPQDVAPAMALAPGEGHMVNKPVSGARIAPYRDRHPTLTGQITQHFGDSASFDFSEFAGTCALFFVDGSHAYDYLCSDTRAAMEMMAPGGVIVWHDYGVWEGVTSGLEEIEARDKLGLQNIRGTSLVVWRKPS